MTRAEVIVRAYRALADARDPRVLDLVGDDVEFHCPRFGRRLPRVDEPRRTPRTRW